MTLDVWDAQALAQELAEPDLCYLAVQYLHLPSELAPPPPEQDDALPDWYIVDRAWWRARTDPAHTLGELIDLRPALRYATFHAEARADLADWLSYARSMLAAATDADVVLRCQYEIAVATLRGTNTLRPADDLVRAFYTEVIGSDVDAGLLQDAVVLGQYCFGAFGRGITGLSLDDLTGWHEQLRSKVRGMLDASPFPNAEAHLLVAAHRVPNRVRVPPVVVEQPLHPVRAQITGLLGDRPRVLPLRTGQQPQQIQSGPAPGFHLRELASHQAEQLVEPGLPAGQAIIEYRPRRGHRVFFENLIP